MSGPFAEYWAALSAGDGGHAVGVAIRELDRGVPLTDLLDGLVCAGQAEVGRLWAANEWNVAQEHRATSIGEEVLAALAARTAAPAGERTIVVTCVDGEWHSLPSRVLAAALRAEGYRVDYLGASVPTRHVAQLLYDRGPDVLAVSCALPTRLLHARELVETARAVGTPVLVGGPGFGPDGRWGLALGADAWAPDARAALRLLERGELPVFTTPAPPHPEPDDAMPRLRSAARAVTDESLERMLAHMPDVARYDAGQVERTREDVGHIVDFLCAALYVDDERLFTDFVGWLEAILVARGVPAATLRAGLRVVAQTIDDRCGPVRRAQFFLDAGIDAVV